MLILKILYIGSKRSHSEQDLLNMTIAGSTETTVTKTSFKNRILTSIPGFGSGSSSNSSSSNSSTSANHHHHQQQQMTENDK